MALNLPEARTLEDINRIELRPADNMYKVRLEQTSKWESPREIQVDAIDGEILNSGVRGDQLWTDLHSFAVFDSEGHWIELITMVLAGLSLIWLTLSGYHLFSIALYVGEHYVIQSLPSEGVTDRYTDQQTYSWASQGWPRYGFTIYGFLPGVSY